MPRFEMTTDGRLQTSPTMTVPSYCLRVKQLRGVLFDHRDQSGRRVTVRKFRGFPKWRRRQKTSEVATTTTTNSTRASARLRPSDKDPCCLRIRATASSSGRRHRSFSPMGRRGRPIEAKANSRYSLRCTPTSTTCPMTPSLGRPLSPTIHMSTNAALRGGGFSRHGHPRPPFLTVPNGPSLKQRSRLSRIDIR